MKTRTENEKLRHHQLSIVNGKLSIILSVIYGLCVFLFFWKLFPYHLHFQEQFQMFLFTQDYFVQTISRPGGFSNYAGRFFTQFFVSTLAGALLVSCFLTGIQLLVYATIRRFGKSENWSFRRLAGLFLSFMPSLFYWYLLCDSNSQMGGVIALLFALIIAWIGTFPKSLLARGIYLFASIPVLYWLSGGVVILSVLILLLYNFSIAKKDQGSRFKVQDLIISMVSVFFAISLPFIAKHFLVQYPLERFWWGVDYIHFTSFSPLTITYLWLLILLIVVGVPFLPNKSSKKPKSNIDSRRSLIQLFSYSVVPLLALFLCIYIVIFRNAYPQNLSREELMAYDYECRMHNWNEVIKMADRKSPTIPMTVASLNLALYKTGQLPEKMFNYYQNGPEGLLPTFKRDFMIPTVGGEPYYYLGLVNTAQRFAFEAMEALPDYQKSARSIKRLAETNIINGNYEVASKYLYLLENTLFYKKWAKEARTYLYNDAKIEAHPEWGEIRRFQTSKDFLFSEREKDMMLGIIFQQHPNNRMAYEYLMAYTLLIKDIKNFPTYFWMKKDYTYKTIPKSWQEAMVYIWGLSNKDLSAIPLSISETVKQQVTAYADIYTSVQSPEPILRKQFPKTYWYYMHFRDYPQIKPDETLQY